MDNITLRCKSSDQLWHDELPISCIHPFTKQDSATLIAPINFSEYLRIPLTYIKGVVTYITVCWSVCDWISNVLFFVKLIEGSRWPPNCKNQQPKEAWLPFCPWTTLSSQEEAIKHSSSQKSWQKHLKQAAYIRDYPLHIQELIWLLGIFAHSIYTETSQAGWTWLINFICSECLYTIEHLLSSYQAFIHV